MVCVFANAIFCVIVVMGLMCNVHTVPSHSTACKTILESGFYVTQCSRRELEKIPWDIPNVVRTLYFDHNKLTEIKGAPFLKCSYAKKLFLKNNSISYIEDSAFQGLRRLDLLDLDNNQLTEIPKGWNHVPRLKTLRLRHNKLVYIPNDAFSDLSHLEELYLNYNHIQNLAVDSFAGLYSLNWLELNNNNIRTMDQRVASHFPRRMIWLRLYDNPWQCDCSLRWLKQWLDNSSIHWKFNKREPHCQSPWLVANEAFSDISEDLFICPVHIMSSSRMLTIEEKGYTAHIVCDVYGDPPPAVMWFSNGDEISNYHVTDKYHIRNTGRTTVHSSLRIFNFQLEDIGAYTCQAINPGRASNVTFLVTLKGIDPMIALRMRQNGKGSLGTKTLIAIIVGSVVMLAAVILVVCIIVRHRYRGKRYAVRLTLDEHLKHNGVIAKTEPIHEHRIYGEVLRNGKPLLFPNGFTDDDDDDDVDSMYNSMRVTPVKPIIVNAPTTPTYISFRSDPSDADLMQLYGAVQKQHSYDSRESSQAESTSPLLDHHNHYPGGGKLYTEQYTDPHLLNSSHNLNYTSTLPHALPYSTPQVQSRTMTIPKKSVSMGSLGNSNTMPPKKPPRLFVSKDNILSDHSAGMTICLPPTPRHGFGTAV